MKKYILFLSLLSVTAVTNAQSGDNKEPYITKSLSSENIQQAEVKTSGGSITVTGGTGESKIEVYVSGNNGLGMLSKDEIKSRLEEYYTLEVSVSNNKLVAIAKQKQNNMNWKKSLSISFKIYIPGNVSTDLSTSGGSIKLTGLKGNQNFRTSGGSLHIDNVSGKINGRTSGGSIHVSNTTDDVDLSTSGGSIEASKCKGNLQLSTSGGSLNLTDLEGTIDASTSGGRIEGSNITGELSASTSGGSVKLSNISGSVDASTSGGSMDVALTTLGKYVKLHNSGGNIDLQLPKGQGLDLDLSGNKVKVSSLNNFSGNTEEDNITGKLNGGGTPIKVRASSGTVRLSFN
ncbi:MAG TPA: hypothetical protein PLP23_04620 [Panacibacter sp.]|nr:hypothetical protein [Panacibacter sp.]